MDRWTGYSLIGHAAIVVILLGVMVVSLQRQADQMGRWFDRTQKQMERLEKAAPWVDDVERLLDRVLPEKKNARPTD